MNFAAAFSLRTCRPFRLHTSDILRIYTRIIPNKSPSICRQASTKSKGFSETFSADRDDYRKALPAEWAHLPLRLRWARPTLFFFGTSFTIFIAAAYASNAETDADLRLLESWGVFGTGTNRTLKEIKYKDANRHWDLLVEEAQQRLAGVPIGEAGRRACAYIWPALKHPLVWCNARARSDAVIIAALTPLTLAWYIPRLHPILFRHWTHSLRSGKSYTMLTSIFSHQQVQWMNVVTVGACLPLAAEWFCDPFDKIMYESSPWYHLSAFFVTAGMFSLFAPQFITYLRFRSAFKQLARGIPSPYTNRSLNKTLSYSLGVSGALHACLTIPVFWVPHLTLGGPDYQIPWKAVWAGVCAVELGCMFASVRNIGWAANLCGVAFGTLYGCYGPTFWTRLRLAVSNPEWGYWIHEDHGSGALPQTLFGHRFYRTMDLDEHRS
ncbi:hypothetical protein BDZ94DRAFT_1257815 [Collybia nuda]|uniref:Peptidase S54 rhomboid domain-containing protein n=1 Tax=Collybia nuda TaxID=64659 RepID=A0A9P6CFG8_9AGAR|nr:hypothetical protein BDZ94DRAFT_1257815 [Collybia nuda]